MRDHLEHRFLDPTILNRSYGWCREAGEIVPAEDANLVTSRLAGQNEERPDEELHYIILDLDDIKVELIPSSTPGHHHLYIYHPVSKTELGQLVDLLEELQIIEPGIKRGFKERGILCLRKPGVRKVTNAIAE